MGTTMSDEIGAMLDRLIALSQDFGIHGTVRAHDAMVSKAEDVFAHIESLERLTARAEAAERDAARYLALLKNNDLVVNENIGHDWVELPMSALSGWLDAAIAKEGEK